jgi:acyl-CoA dehydrogenase
MSSRSAPGALFGSAVVRRWRRRQIASALRLDPRMTRFKLAKLATQVRIARVFVDECIRLQLERDADSATASWRVMVHRCATTLTDECLQVFGGYMAI